MYSKIHRIQNLTVLACCDKQLVGKVLKEGELEIKVRADFYKDRLIDDKELDRLLEEADNINLLGKKTVAVAIKKGFINEGSIIKIKGIPHAQIFKI